MAKRTRLPPGLRERGGIYYWEKKGTPIGRISKSLGVTDFTVALQRYTAVTALTKAGRWDIIDWWLNGRIDLGEVVSAHHDGRVDQLRAGQVGGVLLLGPEIEAYLAALEGVVAESSLVRYRITLNNLRAHFGDELAMRTLTLREIEAWLKLPRERTSRMKGQTMPWSPASQEFAKRVCKTFWKYTIQHEAELSEINGTHPRISRNPWAGVRVGEDRSSKTTYLPKEKWPDLLTAIRGTPWGALLGCAFLGGLRQQEICHLRREDVDLGPFPVIRVQPRERPVRWQPKRKRSIREVEIGQGLVDLLREHLRSGFAGEVYLFTLDGEKPLHSRMAMKWTEEAFDVAEIVYGADDPDGLTLHSGRHSFASWLVQDGVSLQIVASLLGNSVQVCERHYAHLIPGTRRRAVELMELSLEGGGAITKAITSDEEGQKHQTA